MKSVYIDKNNDKLHLVIIGKDKNGAVYRKRTNNIDKIEHYLIEECKNFLNVEIHDKDLYLYTNSGIRFVIKDYNEMKDVRLMQYIFRKISKAPIVGDNLKQGKNTNYLQQLGLKLLYTNRKKIASLALTGLVLSGSITGVINGLNNLHQQSEETVIEEFDKQNLNENSELEKNEIVVENIVTPEEKQESFGEIEINDIEENFESQQLSIDALKKELSIENRIEETKKLQSTYESYDNTKIMIGARVNIAKMEKLFASEKGKIILEMAEIYGIDPYLLAAKGLTESSLLHDEHCPGGSLYNGYGVGAFQLECPSGKEVISAYNYKTGEEDYLTITMENAIDFRKNTQAAAMHLQNRLNLYNGNVYLALQSYNYGVYMMNVIIYEYVNELGVGRDDVINNINDLGWLEIVKDVHVNPNDYYYKATLNLDTATAEDFENAKAKYKWKHKTYGNGHYIADVLSYYMGLKCQNLNLNGSSTIINFANNEVVSLAQAETSEMIEKTM